VTEATGTVLAEHLSRVDELDLDPVVYLLMHGEPGQGGLTSAEADRAVVLYRCFLKLCVLYPGQAIVPTRQIDQAWHAHLLDTAKYRADCNRVLGRFMDHFPYAGLCGEDDQQAWREDFARTRALLRDHFGLDVGGQPAASVCSNHGNGADCCTGCSRPPTGQARPRPVRDATAL
jgi:hypothetical protein